MLQPLVQLHGWPHQNTPSRIAASSPCGRIEIAAEDTLYDLWRITVRTQPGDEAPLWWASFTRETPAENVGALVQALAAEEIVAEWPGHPTAAWRPLLKAGWTASDVTAVRFQSPDGSTSTVYGTPGPGETVVDGIRVTSPDGAASLTHLPGQDGEFQKGTGPWAVKAVLGRGVGDGWFAALSAATPVRYLAMLTSAVADPAPVVRTNQQITSATRAATLRTAPPRSHNPFSYVEAELARSVPRHPTQGHPRR